MHIPNIRRKIARTRTSRQRTGRSRRPRWHRAGRAFLLFTSMLVSMSVRGESMSGFEVRRATRRDAPDVLATITLAFMTDGPCRFLYPRPGEYLQHFARFVEGFGGRAFEHSGAYY